MPVPAFPHVLRIEPASQCNLACTHCPTGTVDRERGVMDEDLFARVLQQIAANREFIKVVVLYHGGEPLLNRAFPAWVEAIKGINPDIHIKTVSNGMALVPAVVDRLLGCGLDALEVSLDGESAAESEFVRLRSRTDRIVEQLDHLLAEKARRGLARPEVCIASTQFVRDRTLTQPPPPPEAPEWLTAHFGSRVRYKVTYAVRWPHMGDSGQFDSLRVPGDDSAECDHVVSTMTVRADGTVVPCCYDLTTRLPMGNVRDTPLADIWRGAGYAELRDAIATRRYPSICRVCAVVRPPTYLVPRWTSLPLAPAGPGRPPAD